jgi:hypothetical protein
MLIPKIDIWTGQELQEVTPEGGYQAQLKPIEHSYLSTLAIYEFKVTKFRWIKSQLEAAKLSVQVRIKLISRG